VGGRRFSLVFVNRGFHDEVHTAATVGYLVRPTAVWERITLAVAAFLLLKAGWITDLAGFLLSALVLENQLRSLISDRHRRIADSEVAE
jgi:TRAP-type uncharacterized transport system fused permease subunit